ncbi:hypothetical protein MIND_00323300 [Mycena indigotica]|uniref:Polymerase III polypeptide H n=1 Tax=Mycena indigotica TaxID=2126181 RepID=A0A8H6T286_9AGAR|nr:uncharacterized protein MIND_00323300 [Mycena indigotica]KAF7309525.1 hypothetical protein MIND_00323300 [Mycena indigotica]
MFNLAILKDTVAVHPADFGTPQELAIMTELNKKYANRVLHDVGLCICVFDLTEAGEGKVRYGDGFLWYKVVFRMLVFRPFQTEVLLAKVMSSDHNGVRLSLDFFDDIYVPIHYLPVPNAFDPNERAHFWHASGDAEAKQTELLDTPVTERMWIDKGEIVRVRVEGDEFYDDEPGPVKMAEGVQVVKEVQTRAPFTIFASMAEQGLGPVSWWATAQPEDGEEQDEIMEDG